MNNCLSEAPSSFENVVYFEESRGSRISRCSKCPPDGRCQNSQRLYDSEVLLVVDIAPEELRTVLASLKTIPVPNFKELLRVSDLAPEFQILNWKRLRYIERRFKINLNLYKKDDANHTVIVREPLKVDFPKTINIMLSSVPESERQEFENFEIIQDKKLLPQLLVCDVLPDCRFSTYKIYVMERHKKVCAKINVQTQKCKQTAYGDNKTVLSEMVKRGIVPAEALTYRNNKFSTWDIETIEVPIESCAPERGMVTKANLRLLSIAVASNIPGHKPKCWVSELHNILSTHKCFRFEKIWNRQKNHESSSYSSRNSLHCNFKKRNLYLIGLQLGFNGLTKPMLVSNCDALNGSSISNF